MFRLIRDDATCKAWEYGDVQIAMQDERLYLIYGTRLNVSVSGDDMTFHAGTYGDLRDALHSLV